MLSLDCCRSPLPLAGLNHVHARVPETTASRLERLSRSSSRTSGSLLLGCRLSANLLMFLLWLLVCRDVEANEEHQVRGEDQTTRSGCKELTLAPADVEPVVSPFIRVVIPGCEIDESCAR